MSVFEEYTNRVNKLQEENTENKRVEFAFPEYLYRMVEEVAERDNTSKTAAVIKLIRIGDFVSYQETNGNKLVIRDAEDNNHIINFE